MPQNENDECDESFITQFETTLSIRPSNEVIEVDDITIDQSTILNGSLNTIPRVEGLQPILELRRELPNRNGLQHLDRHGSQGHFKLEGELRREYEEFMGKDKESHDELIELLEPSSLIDIELVKFKKTLAEFMNANPQIEKQSPRFSLTIDKTLVLLSPYSSEHSFGRTWMLKSYLSTIFERPQRLLASCIGVAAALSMYPYFCYQKLQEEKLVVL